MKTFIMNLYYRVERWLKYFIIKDKKREQFKRVSLRLMWDLEFADNRKSILHLIDRCLRLCRMCNDSYPYFDDKQIDIILWNKLHNLVNSKLIEVDRYNQNNYIDRIAEIMNHYSDINVRKMIFKECIVDTKSSLNGHTHESILDTLNSQQIKMFKELIDD